MTDRTTRILLIGGLIIGAALLVGPYLSDRLAVSRSQPRAVEARGDLSEFERSSVKLFETVAPSVVQVVALPRGARATGEEGGTSSGTGFVWDDLGHIVTNNHVVENAGTIAVRFANGDAVPAELVGRTPNYDLAVLRVGRTADHPPPIPLGSIAGLKVGQLAFAIGNPFGLDQSLTMGIISALKRRLPTSGGREVADVIQTDAAINPGNSGGPLLDSAGRLIGVNTAIFSPSGTSAGIGFAIPVDVVNRVVPALIRNGRVPTPGIGIMAADEATTTQLGVKGIIIARVVPGSPAERAGIAGVDFGSGALGDIITAIDGKPARRLTDLTDRLEATGVGKPIRLTLQRPGGRTRDVDVEAVDLAAR
jgi:2-alkenal reductase